MQIFEESDKDSIPGRLLLGDCLLRDVAIETTRTLDFETISEQADLDIAASNKMAIVAVCYSIHDRFADCLFRIFIDIPAEEAFDETALPYAS
jgi:hypothetical protein